MGDHFVVLVDRLLTESTLEAAIESSNRAIRSTILAIEKPKTDESSKNADFGEVSFAGKLVECKICQEDDEDSNMETPCYCSGSLKYAHRRCVQRWCNEKGNTMCEICHQQFKPGYTVPAQIIQFERIPMHFRDRNSPRIIAMVSTERNSVDPDFDDDDDNDNDDDYSASSSRSLTSCHSLAIIFMVMLVLRHTLPLIISGHKNDYPFPVLMLLFLRTIGIVLPIYVMVRAVTAIHHHHRSHQRVLPVSSSDTSARAEPEHTVMQLNRDSDDPSVP